MRTRKFQEGFTALVIHAPPTIFFLEKRALLAFALHVASINYSEVSLNKEPLIKELAPRLASSSIFAFGIVCKPEIVRSEGSGPGF